MYGLCQHYCLTDAAGFSYCGDGPQYNKGEDCRKCAPTVSSTKLLKTFRGLYRIVHFI